MRRARFGWLGAHAITALLLAAGCGAKAGKSVDGATDIGADLPSDRTDADGPGDVEDVADATNSADGADAADTANGVDARDAADAADTGNVVDAADAADAVGATDSGDAADAPTDLPADTGGGGSMCPEAGVPCTGPEPACAGACADSDGDGLNDAWEAAHGIDMNCDGVIDATHDVLLPAADPNRPDIYVYYDWMDYAGPGNACSADDDCPAVGSAHAGERCTGPQVIPTATGTCEFACTTDADCTARASPGAHASDKCRNNSCVHTHDPEATAPGSLDAVVDAFADHGIALHILRGKALRHSLVVSTNKSDQLSDTCEGGSNPSGTAGVGNYAVSFYDLKALPKVDRAHLAYHQTVFAHYLGCDTKAHCMRCGGVSGGESGFAEIGGENFIVSLGNRAVDFGVAYTIMSEGGTFMHELGHNLGIHHGGGIDTACTSDADCRGGVSCTATLVGKFCVGGNDTNWKPNYLSVMNYRYQFTGIAPAKVAGGTESIGCDADSDCPAHTHCGNGVCARLDYSSAVLPTGGNTPGALEERNIGGLPGLNEPAGLGAATSDLFSYTDAKCDVPNTFASTVGPVDWDGDGATDATNISADLNSGFDHACGAQLQRLPGASDWVGPFSYKFQCTAYGGPNSGGAPSGTGLTHELTTSEAIAAHVLYPPRSVRAILGAGSALARDRRGSVRLIVHGAPGFSVADVDATSLFFHGARPAGVVVRDLNGDGRLDLVATFKRARATLHPKATRARLRGWLIDGQLFTAEIALP